MISTFHCVENGQRLSILDYERNRTDNVRYKAVINDGQLAVLQLQTVGSEDAPDVSQLSLCPGVAEPDFLGPAAIEKLLIEKSGDEIVLRNRDCRLLININQEEPGPVCPACLEIFGDMRVKVHGETELKQENIDDGSEHEDLVSELDVDLNPDGQKVEPIVIPILKRKKSVSEKADEKKERRRKKKKEFPIFSKEANPEEDQLFYLGDTSQKDPDWDPTEHTRANKEVEEEDGGKSVKIREKLHHCDICGKNFCGAQSLAKHKLLHTGEKPHSCPFCEEKYRIKSRLVTHLKYSHPQERDSEVYKQTMADNTLPGLVCPLCGMQFESNNCLVKHNAKIHDIHIHTLPCGVCGKLCKDELSLYMHMRNIHERRNKVLCGVCGKSVVELARHMEVHSTTWFPCVECGKEYKTTKQMRRHVLRMHSDKKKQHKCQTCDKAFWEPSDLKKHVSQIHDKLKPFYCEVCQFRTATISNLNIHRKKSHERPSISRKSLIELVETGQHPFHTLSDIPMIRSGPY